MLIAYVAGGRKHRNRLAGFGKIPAGQIEEVDGFLQNPVANLFDIVAPAARALPIGIAPQLDQAIARVAYGPFVHHLFDPSPKRGEPELMADGQEPLLLL